MDRESAAGRRTRPTSGLRTPTRGPLRLGHISPATASSIGASPVTFGSPTRASHQQLQFDPGFYGLQTLNHELGHSLGLIAPGRL